MKLLVTGGAGFIGSNFVHYYLEAHPQDSIVVLDKLTYAGHLENLAGLTANSRYQFVQGDILNYQLVDGLVKDVQAIVHFAAETHVDRSLAGLDAAKLFNETNINGTLVLLDAAKNNGNIRFHHISTDEVYGDLPYDEPNLKFHEDYSYNPHSPYSISKAASDYYARLYHHTYGLPVTISNCTNNYGPFQTPEKMIPRSIALLLAGQKLKLYVDKDGNPGPNVRDWIHVYDHNVGVDLILQKGKIGETYCLGGKAELSNKQLVERMLVLMTEITGQPFSYKTHVELVADRPGHDRRYAMDTTKAEKELGWVQKYSFDTGFKETVAWYTGEGKAWLESLKETTTEVRADQDKNVQREK